MFYEITLKGGKIEVIGSGVLKSFVQLHKKDIVCYKKIEN